MYDSNAVQNKQLILGLSPDANRKKQNTDRQLDNNKGYLQYGAGPVHVGPRCKKNHPPQVI